MSESYRSLVLALALVVLWLCSLCEPVWAQPDVLQVEQSALSAAVLRIAPCVVRIETVGGLERVGEVSIPAGPTSGLIVSADGFIVSSAFSFVQQPTSILVTFADGTRAPAQLVARDRSRMLVLLKVDVDRPLPVPEAAPREEWFVGQWCIAVGRSFAVDQPNVSVGILSARERIWGKAVQTDAKVSPANYGGPLVDIYGRVIGVLVPLSPQGQDEMAGVEWYDSGIGFAVPLVDIFMRLNEWKLGRDLMPGLLGISFKDRNDLWGEPILGVVRVNSPAEKAGLRVGDRISHVNGRSVRRIADVKHLLGPLYAGDTVELTVVRDGQPLTVSAVLVDKLVPYAHAMLGVLPDERTGEPPGIGVRWVFPGSPAHRAGMRVGDRIIEMDGQPLSNSSALRELMLRRQPGESIEIRVERQAERAKLKMELSGLPDHVPSDVPTRQPVQPNRGQAQPELVTVQVPEEPNECRLWVPESYDPQKPCALVVWLQPAGQYDPQTVVSQWRDVCHTRQVLMLFPNSREPTGWRPTELEFIRKAIELVANQYRIDPQRIVVGGEELGATMSYVAAFSLREQVRGLIVSGAGLPLRLTIPDNDPLYRLSVLFIVPGSGRVKAAMTQAAEKLREARYAVVAIQMAEQQTSWTHAEYELVGRWLELLDIL